VLSSRGKHVYKSVEIYIRPSVPHFLPTMGRARDEQLETAVSGSWNLVSFNVDEGVIGSQEMLFLTKRSLCKGTRAEFGCCSWKVGLYCL
jgi:hypothetical protein